MDFKYAAVRDSLVRYIKENVEGKDVGVAFSGGLDSGLVSALAKRYAKSVTLYTCGTENAFDVVVARKLAQDLDLPWVHVLLTKGMIEDRIKEFITATDNSDPFTISYELQLFSVCRESNEEIILTGQGADEYFMGCAKFVGQNDEDYDTLVKAGKERLLDVSVPCELKIGAYFGKRLVYPYLSEEVLNQIEKIDPRDMMPKDLDSRKFVLKEIAVDLGYHILAERKKKSSQYGSGTTDLVRGVAKSKGMMYNQYIGSVYDEVKSGTSEKKKEDNFVYARIDPIVKAKAEMILQKKGISISGTIERFYEKIIEEDGTDFLERRIGK